MSTKTTQPKKALCSDCGKEISEGAIRDYRNESGTTGMPRICSVCADRPNPAPHPARDDMANSGRSSK